MYTPLERETKSQDLHHNNKMQANLHKVQGKNKKIKADELSIYAYAGGNSQTTTSFSQHFPSQM